MHGLPVHYLLVVRVAGAVGLRTVNFDIAKEGTDCSKPTVSTLRA